MFELEIKARSSRDIEAKVNGRGEFVCEETQLDTYVQHPSRDFRKTNEALRVREANGIFLLVYKGPRLPAKIKKRREIEYHVSAEVFELFEALGFKKHCTIKKRRRFYRIDGMSVVLDDVDGLGSFIEIESMDSGDEDAVIRLAGELNISQKDYIHETYLEMAEKQKR